MSHQDIQLAKQLFALTPSSQSSDIANEHGADIILGGHDHLYFVGRGVDEWDNYDLSDHVLGAEEDNGDVMVIKSGTDFRDISEICLELKDTPKGSARKKLIGRVTGKCMLYRIREDIGAHAACPQESVTRLLPACDPVQRSARSLTTFSSLLVLPSRHHCANWRQNWMLGLTLSGHKRYDYLHPLLIDP
jgi:hypothetical protein